MPDTKAFNAAPDGGSGWTDVGQTPATYFAPAGRAGADEVDRVASRVRAEPLLTQALDCIPLMVLILNSHRQVIAANRSALETLHVDGCAAVGRRPGEVIGCVRAPEGPDGCGTSRHCAYCGAVEAILAGKEHWRRETRECRIQVQTPDGIKPLDLRATVSPLQLGRDLLLVAAIEDISAAKRVAVVQRAIFHEILNNADCIRGYAEFLEEEPAAAQDIPKRLSELSEYLVEDLLAHRELAYAESGQLQMQPEPVLARSVLERLRIRYLRHPAASGQRIEVQCSWNGTVHADRRLLQRVLGNMVKNALEASGPGETVALECRPENGAVVFSVHNEAVMPEAVAHQVFQRSFTTKEQPGRGVGTYAVKLLGERYLGGKVDFSSRPCEGTTFRLTLPAPRAQPAPASQTE
jgi:signal transduction histidine kinase